MGHTGAGFGTKAVKGYAGAGVKAVMGHAGAKAQRWSRVRVRWIRVRVRWIRVRVRWIRVRVKHRWITRDTTPANGLPEAHYLRPH